MYDTSNTKWPQIMVEEENIEEELQDTKEELEAVIEGIKKEKSSEEQENKSKTVKKSEDLKNEEGKYVDPDTGKKFDTMSALKIYRKNIKQ